MNREPKAKVWGLEKESRVHVQGEGAQGLGRLVKGQGGFKSAAGRRRSPAGALLSAGTAAPPPSTNVYRPHCLHASASELGEPVGNSED